jgi:hypothetical protein
MLFMAYVAEDETISAEDFSLFSQIVPVLESRELLRRLETTD